MSLRVSEIKTVEIERCIPRNPVYLEWMNKAGGWDRFVFGVTQTEGIDTSITVLSKTPIEDYESATTSQEAHGRRSLPRMILGAENLDANRMRGITGLLDAAKTVMMIEWNQPAAPVFRTVIVEPGSFKTFETGEQKQNIEFTIALAEINVQLL
jgi:hypothetical protein